MNRQIFKYLGHIVLIVAILLVLLIAAASTLKPDPESYLHEWVIKRQRFETLNSPRILFLGDSNLAFGLDSKRIMDSTHCNVQNAGLHGGIGLQYCIQEYEDLIMKGDIVVICCAYDQYTNGRGGQSTLPVVIFHNHWHGINKLTLPLWKVFLSGFHSIFSQPDDEVLCSERAYRASYFNEYGDEAKHWEMNPLDSIPKGKLGNQHVNKVLMRYLFKRVTEWEGRGAQVLFMPAAIPQDYYDESREALLKIEKELIRRGHPFMVPIDSCVYDESFMYDCLYHLNKEGVDRFTGQMIEALKQQMHEDSNMP